MTGLSSPPGPSDGMNRNDATIFHPEDMPRVLSDGDSQTNPTFKAVSIQ